MADPIVFTDTTDITFFNTIDIHWSGTAIVVFMAPLVGVFFPGQMDQFYRNVAA